MARLKEGFSHIAAEVKRVILQHVLNGKLMETLDLRDPYIWLATWGGCGFSKYAPGTIGTLGALPLGYILMVIGGSPWIVMGFLIVSVLGFRASRVFEESSGTHDNGAIVIDEVAGVLLALAFAPMSYIGILLAFILFRFFDILKPWPISLADKKIDGALGVMLDDVLAGAMAALCLWGLHYGGFI